VRDLCSFDYAIVRVVPRVDRGEFINAGVILFCSTKAFLDARIELDRTRLGQLAQRARFHWLVAPRSTIIQMSPMHSGVNHDPEAALEALFRKLVKTP
jgi:hypothetical protein